jgi:CelD/BcsL family acetyltransferase involved in cellulose biosynthesis
LRCSVILSLMHRDVSPPTAGLRVRQVDPAADGRWDRYVLDHPEGLVYHHSGWLRALQREYGQRPSGLALEGAAGELHGVLPLMVTRGVPFQRAAAVTGPRLASLPRTPVAGPLADDREGLAALLAAAVQRTPPGAHLQLKLPERRLDGLVAGVVGHPWRLTYVLELPAAGGELRFGGSRNHSAIKRAVDKARRAGVRARRAETVDEVRAWYPLYLETMRHHMIPARPLRLFEAMWQELRPQGMMELLLAERDGGMLAGLVLLMLGSTVFYGFNGALRDAFDLRPNDLLHWEAIHDAAAAGYRWYDFGEVVEHQEGLARFKRKWGTEPRRMHRYYHPAPQEPPDPGDGEQGRAARLAARVWPHLPLRATAVAGDLVYRFL